jgi:hypothetical protein
LASDEIITLHLPVKFNFITEAEIKMKNYLLILITIFPTLISVAQNQIEWDGKYQLQLSDFKGAATQIGGTDIYSLSSTASIDFAYRMSAAEFMFTKNFNSKVGCSFKTSAATLVAPDSLIARDLLEFSRYEFDLCELYARKLRQRIYEKKGAFSDANFIQPLYEEIQKELNERHSLAAKTSDLGRNHEVLNQLHQDVLAEIKLLDEFCKSCKPKKKK